MCIYYLQLNTTCDAYSKNCSQSAAVNSTIINTLKNECYSPIYSIVDTIASHSNKLLLTIKHLKDLISKSNKDDLKVATTTNIDVNNLCLSNI